MWVKQGNQEKNKDQKKYVRQKEVWKYEAHVADRAVMEAAHALSLFFIIS